MSEQKIIFLDEEIRSENFEEDCAHILLTLRPLWKKDDIKFEMLAGGLVNSMMFCRLQNDDEIKDGIIFRLYGEGGIAKLITRKREFIGLQVGSAVGVGPRILARFKNGICLTYLKGRTLTYPELQDPKIMRLIAKSLARFHAVDVSKLQLRDLDGNPCQPDEAFPTEEAMKQMVHFIPPYESIKDEHLRNRIVKELPPLQELVQEFIHWKQEIKNLDFPTAFCHNDIHHKNIIYDEQKEELNFIDYEGFGKNYQTTEISKFLNIKLYYESLDMAAPEDNDFDLETYTVFLQQLLSEYYLIKNGDGFVSDLDLRRAVLESQIYSMIANLGYLLFSLFAIHNPMVKADTSKFVFIGNEKFSSGKMTLSKAVEEYQAIKKEMEQQ